MKTTPRKKDCLRLKGNEFTTNLCAVSFVPRPKPIIQRNKRQIRIIKELNIKDNPFSSTIDSGNEYKKVKELNDDSMISEEGIADNKVHSSMESKCSRIAKTSIDFYKKPRKELVLGILESRYHKDYIQELINNGSRIKISTDKIRKAIVNGKRRMFTSFKTEINRSKINKSILYIGLTKKCGIRSNGSNLSNKLYANDSDSFCDDAYLDDELKSWLKGKTDYPFEVSYPINLNENEEEQVDWAETELFMRVMNGDICDLISEVPILTEQEIKKGIEDSNIAKSTLLALYKNIGLKSLLNFINVVYC
jgi:hypothetical protein